MAKLLILVFLVILNVCVSTTAEIVTEIDLSDSSKRFEDFEKEFSNLDDNNEFFLSDLVSGAKDTCDLRPNASEADYYYFLPSLKASVKKEGNTFEFGNKCFKRNVVTLVKLSEIETVITVEASEPSSLFCKDLYWLTTSNINHVKTVFFHGKHRIVLKNLSQDDVTEIKVNGLRLFAFCTGFYESLKSFFMSLKLYVGGLGVDPEHWIPILRPKVPEYMVKANVDFLNRFTDYKPIAREKQYADNILDIDINEIHSGDFITITRFDGLDPLIMLGTGSHSGHSAVAAWMNGELYVLESQDGWYWPRHGIQKNKWHDWIKWAHNADFNVAILPLREEIRQKFDVDKALKWYFEGVEGLNYGYHNFLFSWLDTPNRNLPSLLDHEILMSVFSILEKVSRKTADTIIGEALNHRLSTKGLSIHQISVEGAKRGITFEEIIAMKEIEGWPYSDGSNYVCSCFVAAFWKNGGVFGDLEIIPTEFTPKDIYQVDIFDLGYKDRRPQICKDADPELPYCQVIGKYRLSLIGYSTVVPYSHMNEKCPSIAPLYEREEGC